MIYYRSFLYDLAGSFMEMDLTMKVEITIHVFSVEPLLKILYHRINNLHFIGATT